MDFDYGTNFKGIMLCTRPLSVSEANLRAKSSTWNCKKVDEPVGLSKCYKKDASGRRERKLNVIQKHKKWLAELQWERSEMAVKRDTKRKEDEDSRNKFEATESENRRKQIEINRSESSNTNTLATISAFEKVKHKKRSKKISQNYRPAWALSTTESTSEANEVNNNQPSHLNTDIEGSPEDDELLQFAANLDFESDTQDMEVRSMIDVLQTRISELEKEVENDQLTSASREGLSTTSASQQRYEKRETSANAVKKRDEEDGEDDDEDKRLLREARNLLSRKFCRFRAATPAGVDDSEYEEDERALQLIHSQRSLAAVLKALRQSFYAKKDATAS